MSIQTAAIQPQAEANNPLQGPEEMTSTGQATPAGMTTPLSGNTPQDRAIVITDGENISLRRPIAQQPPIMVSNNELLIELLLGICDA